MRTHRHVALGFALSLAVACSSSGDGNTIDPIPCQAANCGKDSFRSAIPSRSLVSIDFEKVSRNIAPKALAERRIRPGAGKNQRALAEFSPYYEFLVSQVDEINLTIDDVFTEIEALAATEPEIADDDLHRWRIIDPVDDRFDVVLTMTTSNDIDFTLDYAIVPADLEPAVADTILYGDVKLAADLSRTDFTLIMDFDIATDITPSLELTGELQISAMPFADGVNEIWYDFKDFGVVGGTPVTSLTTYWLFNDDLGSGALEYLDDFHDDQATIYARWDDLGGRLDYHLVFEDATYGLLDEISTGCWDKAIAETFYGWALIDQDLDYFMEIEGTEDACDFGVLDGHPDPGPELRNLPADGEWATLEAASVPFCEDDLEPDAPGCISLCTVFPADCTL